MDVERNCPTCQHNLEGPRCGMGRQRINKNEKGEWIKTVFCPVWGPKVVQLAEFVKVCPTCGQVIISPEVVKEEIEPVDDTPTNTPIIPLEEPKPVKRVRRRGAAIFPEGRTKSKRRFIDG